ncbi:GNAT family N-acetyltransferase [Thermoproteota archaeon]
MSEKFIINECCAEDVNCPFRDLWLALADEMYELEHYTLPTESNANSWIKYIREGIQNKRNLVLGAFIENQLVGFISASLSRTFSWDIAERMASIDDLYVLPVFRRRGIATKLMVECLDRLESSGSQSVRVNLISSNESALSLYAKLGFNIYRHSMKKELDPKQKIE